LTMRYSGRKIDDVIEVGPRHHRDENAGERPRKTRAGVTAATIREHLNNDYLNPCGRAQ
jgi:hypothetical protein